MMGSASLITDLDTAKASLQDISSEESIDERKHSTYLLFGIMSILFLINLLMSIFVK